MSDQTVYDFTVKNIDNINVNLSEFKGKVLLIVNTASKCGFTKQYAGLEELYQKYNKNGFEIIAFPCNQFGHQEPGDADEIKQFCNLNYDITFPIMQKIDVNGSNTEPLYSYLKHNAHGLFFTTKIKWNFTKFLIGQDGKVIRRYSPIITPLKLECKIKSLLGC